MKKFAILLALCATFMNTAGAGEPSEAIYKVSVPSTPAFVPSKVWDDGKFTFIELQKPYRGELPVVFALSDDGSRQLVNYQWDEQNSRLVVQRLFERAVLVNGDKTVILSRS